MRRAVLLLPTLLVGACAPQNLTVASAFPRTRMAAPWVLDGAVWTGSFADAQPALGPDARPWQEFNPERVWLAVYRHEAEQKRTMTVRAFAFSAPKDARAAYARARVSGAKEFQAGDEGCWTGIGVLFVWGRLVFDVFGPQASLANELEAARLTAFIQKNMPRGMPDDPQ